MNAQEILKNVKNLLGMELSTEEVQEFDFAQLKLENGTTLEAESFESGKEVFILTEDEKVAVPVGEYEMEDGNMLVVKEEGVISEIKAAEEKEEEPKEEEKEDEKEEMAYVTKEEFGKAMDEIKAAIADLMKDKEEMSAEQVGKIVTEELAAQEKVELSETPAAEPIKHNPEQVESKVNLRFAQNRPMSTLDRVMSKLTNN